MRYEARDITTVQAPALIAHGVNCSDAMGSGVARAIYMKWPTVKSQYHTHGSMELGDAQFVEIYTEENLVVANCFTQQNYGRTGEKFADLWAIEKALYKAAQYAIFTMDISSIHIPKIGSGLGGLDWNTEVRPLLEGIEEMWYKDGLQFVVCSV
jgi:O-acetyl-ADP-ribose deacetylase (regulator of RNase III)